MGRLRVGLDQNEGGREMEGEREGEGGLGFVVRGRKRGRMCVIDK